jgi:uncharacterized membrane protein
MRRAVVGIAALAGSFAFTLAEYSRLPARVPIHWNAHFRPDGYASRASELIFPIVMLVVLPALAYVLPRIDPHHANYAKHEGTYWFIWSAIMVLLAAVQVLVVGAGLGWNVHMSIGLPLMIGLLFIVLGNVMGRVRPNWFLGIRTPWTLSSDEVWRKTHRLGSRTFMLGGLVLVIAALIPYDWGRVAGLFVAVGLAALVPTIYSYVEWRRLGRPSGPARAA